MKNYILIIFTLAILILFVFLVICNTSETFRMPTIRDTSFLSENCFDYDSVKEYERYYDYADVKEIENKALVFTTPIEKIRELQNFNLNRYGNGLLINNMCVTPDNRRKGMAKKLITNIIKQAQKSNRINFLFLQVKQSNAAAHNMYLKLGFKEQHRFTGSKGENYINMILKV